MNSPSIQGEYIPLLYRKAKELGIAMDRETLLAYFKAHILSRLIIAGCREERRKPEPVIIPIPEIDETMILSPHGGKMKGGALEYTTEDLQLLLSGMRIRLDCGHRCTVGHNLANTLIIVSKGGGRLDTLCHSCY